jgi:hypothetical protein
LFFTYFPNYIVDIKNMLVNLGKILVRIIIIITISIVKNHGGPPPISL